MSAECRRHMGAGVSQTAPAGAVLYLEGAEADRLFEVHSGRVALCVSSAHGREVEVLLRGPGSLIGLEGLVRGQYLTSARAVMPTFVSAYAADAMRREMERHPGGLWNICRELVEEIQALEKMVLGLGSLTALERLAEYLFEEAQRNGGSTVNLPRGSKGLLARHLAVSQETLSRLLQILAEKGFIRLRPGGLVVLAADQLRTFAR